MISIIATFAIIVQIIIAMSVFMWMSNTEAYYDNFKIDRAFAVNEFVKTCTDENLTEISTCNGCDLSGLPPTQICYWGMRIYKDAG
jgi:hypothetical protein